MRTLDIAEVVAAVKSHNSDAANHKNRWIDSEHESMAAAQNPHITFNTRSNEIASVLLRVETEAVESVVAPAGCGAIDLTSWAVHLCTYHIITPTASGQPRTDTTHTQCHNLLR